MITQSQTQIQTKTPIACTCASCPKFNDYNEPRGRGWCQLFDRVAFSHHPFTLDCQLNLASDTELEEDTTDSIGQQIQDTRLLLEKAKRRYYRQFPTNLNTPF